MIIRAGTAERMTRVNDHEPRNARTKQAMHVVQCCNNSPDASEEAIRMSSVCLRKKRLLERKGHKANFENELGEGGHKATCTEWSFICVFGGLDSALCTHLGIKPSHILA